MKYFRTSAVIGGFGLVVVVVVGVERGASEYFFDP